MNVSKILTIITQRFHPHVEQVDGLVHTHCTNCQLVLNLTDEVQVRKQTLRIHFLLWHKWAYLQKQLAVGGKLKDSLATFNELKNLRVLNKFKLARSSKPYLLKRRKKKLNVTYYSRIGGIDTKGMFVSIRIEYIRKFYPQYKSMP